MYLAVGMYDMMLGHKAQGWGSITRVGLYENKELQCSGDNLDNEK